VTLALTLTLYFEVLATIRSDNVDKKVESQREKDLSYGREMHTLIATTHQQDLIKKREAVQLHERRQ